MEDESPIQLRSLALSIHPQPPAYRLCVTAELRTMRQINCLHTYADMPLGQHHLQLPPALDLAELLAAVQNALRIARHAGAAPTTLAQLSSAVTAEQQQWATARSVSQAVAQFGSQTVLAALTSTAPPPGPEFLPLDRWIKSGGLVV